ncbi:MAG: hypothetical protein K6G88_04075 [Lachnospiraceae bacterium]|nr:hypothetical protein [Lachnospiraceae bacterium]
MLAKDADVDKEVVELSALLHDISMTDATLDRSNPEDVKEKGCDYVSALRKVNQSYEY